MGSRAAPFSFEKEVVLVGIALCTCLAPLIHENTELNMYNDIINTSNRDRNTYVKTLVYLGDLDICTVHIYSIHSLQNEVLYYQPVCQRH